MESHQLPASRTVRTPDFTSCLSFQEKNKYILIFEGVEAHTTNKNKAPYIQVNIVWTLCTRVLKSTLDVNLTLFPSL